MYTLGNVPSETQVITLRVPLVSILVTNLRTVYIYNMEKPER